VGELCLPVAFELVNKTQWIFNEKKDRWQRKSPQTKNELYRRMLKACAKNRVKFRYVLNDVWYASSENMRYVKEDLKKSSSCP
jgi:ribonuclease HI